TRDSPDIDGHLTTSGITLAVRSHRQLISRATGILAACSLMSLLAGANLLIPVHQLLDLQLLLLLLLLLLGILLLLVALAILTRGFNKAVIHGRLRVAGL